MTTQDSINVFQNPVDSARVAAQDVTSEQITNMLNWQESLMALWNLVEPQYLVFVCISYYIVVTRVQVIKTNSFGRRNALMFLLTIMWGVILYFWQSKPPLNLLATGLFVNFCYEFIFKGIFKGLERIGWTPLPQWHVDEIKQEKQADITRAEQVKKQP